MTKPNPSQSVKRQAWFRFYPDDFISGTAELSAHDRGVYITLLARMYACEGRIKNDHQSLARLCGTRTTHFRKALEALIESGKIVDEGSTLTNKRCLDELDINAQIRAVNSQNSRSRWEKEKTRKPSKNNGGSKKSHDDRMRFEDAESMPARASPEPDNPPIVPPSKRDAGPYIIERGLVRITQQTFDEWREVYWAIPDLRAAIYKQATWGEGRYQPNDWFHRLSQTLGNMHQQLVADGAKRPLSEEARAKLDDWKKRFDAAGEMDFGPDRDAALAALRDEAKTAKANLEAWAMH
ncbi:MAG: YdaU family protein [Alphaproteobacteria bacterium]|nr:YdaU family protein [Alphaproteobacteria bacterium]